MKKAMKHILSLCIMLLFGSTTLFAHSAATPLFITSSIQHTSPEKDNKINSEFNFQTKISSPIKEFYSKRVITTDTEEEDTEITYSKKSLEKTTSFVALYKPQFTTFLPYATNNSLTLIKETFYFPSYNSLYIVFEVFRI